MYNKIQKSSINRLDPLLKNDGTLDYDKTNEFYELDTAVVIRVVRHPADIYVLKVRKNAAMATHIGAILCKPINATVNINDGSFVLAYPLNPNIKQYPAEGEFVRVGKYGASDVMFYELLNYNNSVNYNGSSDILRGYTKQNTEPMQDADGAPDTQAVRKTTFRAAVNRVPLLTPVSSDTIIESRFGSALRMTDISSKTDSDNYVPVLVLSNNIAYTPSQFFDENVNVDGSNLIMLSGNSDIGLNPTAYTDFFRTTRSTGFKTAYEKSTTYRDNTGPMLFLGGINQNRVTIDTQATVITNDFLYPASLTGNQMILSSDRIILNAKLREILMYSKGQIGLFTSEKFSVDAAYGIDFSTPRSSFRVNSNIIYLNSLNLYLCGGDNQTFLTEQERQRNVQPAVLGSSLIEFLENVFGTMYQYFKIKGVLNGSQDDTASGIAGEKKVDDEFTSFMEGFVFDSTTGKIRLNPTQRDAILSDKVFIGNNGLNPTFDYRS